MKVLIVDDSGTMRTIQRRCLNMLGINEVAEAEDGVQALDLFERANFDIILSDWNMPNMDGLTLLKEIRQRDANIPVIMITTEAERARVVTAIQAGVSDYLIKPFTPDVLKEKMERWVTIPS
ncbi:MAG: response regulator [Planctomycetaceae bacterium]|nr:response regulator [Planctomycetaceae bacterium]